MTFTRDGLKELHAATHESLDVLIGHIAAGPPDLPMRPVAGFGRGTIREQLVPILSRAYIILTTESGWVSSVQSRPVARLDPARYATSESIMEAKRTVSEGTRTYINSLDERELNTGLGALPNDWVGPRRSPAFILPHVMTHAFHHKGRIAAMPRGCSGIQRRIRTCSGSRDPRKCCPRASTRGRGRQVAAAPRQNFAAAWAPSGREFRLRDSHETNLPVAP